MAMGEREEDRQQAVFVSTSELRRPVIRSTGQ